MKPITKLIFLNLFFYSSQLLIANRNQTDIENPLAQVVASRSNNHESPEIEIELDQIGTLRHTGLIHNQRQERNQPLRRWNTTGAMYVISTCFLAGGMITLTICIASK